MVTNFRDRQFVWKQLREKLAEAQAHRAERVTYNTASQRFAWNEYEEGVMLIEVNLFRVMFQKKPVSIEDIRKADDAAAGYIDYTDKFSLNCLYLVYGE